MGDGPDLRATVVAGRYELAHELARGGMGVVYRAIDRATGRTVALKRSQAHVPSSDLNSSMLRREYQTLVTLRHPHIIQVYDFGVDGVGPYYTMELLDGTDLRARCPLPWREVCAYLRDVASSLALLHSRRLLHCDVSVANIRLTTEGRAKLLDFGALATFGRNSVLAGSPPCMAPEVLDGDELDQRADLYALGATAYYALCGEHAYPAPQLGLLRGAWARGQPAPPSAHEPEIPRELDDLVLSLLELDRASRPVSAAEVIDRLGAIAGLAPDQDQRVQRSYLHGPVVGRDLERKVLGDKLARALAGHGGGALIEGAPGLGKTFLLEDITQSARLSGAHVVTVNARAHARPLGVWSALACDGAAGAPNAEALSRKDVEEALFQRQASTALVLAVEDLQEADADSLAALVHLARSIRKRRILLLGTIDLAQPGRGRAALRLLRDQLLSLELPPLDEAATRAFVQGLFGDVVAAPRLSTFLHNHAAGNPRAYGDVIQHLIERGLIRYAEGTWVLPDELPTLGSGGLDIGAIVGAAFENRIARFSPALRALAMCLSPQRRVFTVDLCRVLCEGEPELEGRSFLQLLAELVREGTLVEDQGSYAFAGSRIREILYARLSEAQKRRQHGRLAEWLLQVSGSDPRRGFEIGFHFLCAGEDEKARAHINRNVEASLMDIDLLVESVPDLWALLEQQRAAGASDDDVQFLEGLLATSGYYLDPTIHDRFAHALPLLSRTLGFSLATRLVPWLGRPIALVVGLSVARVRGLFRKPYLVAGSSFSASVLVFLCVCAAVSASACFRLDRDAHARLIQMLDVVRGLPRLNAVRYLYDLFKVGACGVRGRFADLEAGLEDQLERLPRMPRFPEENRHQYEAGLQFFIGRNQLLRLDSTTLRCADRMDALGAMHDRLMAQLLRMTHHLYRGDLAASRREEERFDQLAALIGSRWVADVVRVLEFVPYHLSQDVLGLKRTLHRIEKLVPIAPDLATHREIIRAMYEGHRGRPDLALSIYASLEDQIAPFAAQAWSVARSHQAECLNTLGRHAEALAVCEEARSHLSDADREYVLQYVQLEREAAMALAGLGRLDEATRVVDGLLAECSRFDHPLVIGLLHYDRARVACAGHDREAFELHREAAERVFVGTGNPALMRLAKRLLGLGRQAGVVAPLPTLPPSVAKPAVSALVDRERAARALEEVVQAVGAGAARLYLTLYARAVPSARHGADDGLVSRQLERQIGTLAEVLDGEVTDDDIQRVWSQLPPDLLGSLTLLPLTQELAGSKRQLVGVLVLSECEKPAAVSRLDLVEIAMNLVDIDEATGVVSA